MSELNIMQWNAQGLARKIIELNELLRNDNIDVICISETHFTDNSSPKFNDNYHLLRQDRPSHLGGLLTMIKKDIDFTELNLGLTSVLEYQATLIHASKRVLLINAYLPGGADRQDIKANFLIDLKNILLKYDIPIILTGDLNAKHRLWNNTKANEAGKILLNFTRTFNFMILFPSDPTYAPMSNKKSPSTIDLIITNGKINCSSPFVRKIFTSDHLPSFFKIMTDTAKATPHTKLIPDYRKTNWKKFRDSLDNVFLPVLNSEIPLDSSSLIDTAVRTLQEATKKALNDNIHMTKISRQGTFLTKDMKDAISHRNYLRRRWLRHRRESDRIEYNASNKYIKELFTDNNKKRLREKLSKCRLGDNTIYKMIKNRSRDSIPPLRTSLTDKRHFNDHDKSRLLAEQFNNMHNNPLAKNDIFFTTGIDNYVKHYLDPANSPTTNILIPSKTIHQTICNLKTSKAPGIDEIPIRAAKNLSHIGLEFITKIYNACLTLGYYPVAWRKAKTIPIYKSGKDPSLTSSYRPIALLPTYAKIFDKLINNEITTFCNQQNIIPDNQFGFRKHHSTTHALTQFLKRLKSSLNNKQTAIALTFDIEKAFDRIWHEGLAFKLIKNNFPLYLTKIIYSSLKDRQFQVGVGREISPPMTIPWGVPQGSSLSPTLYNIYISDIPRNTPATLTLYADDTILIAHDRLIATVTERIQTSAEDIIRYYTKWKIKTNDDKTTMIAFTRRKTKQLPPDFIKIGATNVIFSDEIKYLGITIDKRLTFTPHINNTISKVDKVIRLLYPFIARKSLIDVKLKVHIFKTYLRPIMTYAIPILTVTKISKFALLSSKQNKILRMMLDIPWDSFTTTDKLHRLAGIDSLINYLDMLVVTYNRKCSDSDNNIIIDSVIG